MKGKGTDQLQQAIKAHLDRLAQEDALFAKAYAKEKKNLKDCITYIISAVKASGCNGFADEEIYSMAMHYYDEDDLEVGEPVGCDVVVNHRVALTDEEKAQARREAMEKALNEEYARLHRKPENVKKAKEAPKVEQASLF
jgi:hypothetical protein